MVQCSIGPAFRTSARCRVLRNTWPCGLCCAVLDTQSNRSHEQQTAGKGFSEVDDRSSSDEVDFNHGRKNARAYALEKLER